MKSTQHLFAKLLLGILFLGTAVFSQDAAQYGAPFAGVPDIRDINIYQVAIGEYSSTRNFQGVINGLDKIKDLGVNVIYLMPVYPVGASGSPYSIVDMGGINSGFGTLADLRTLVAGAHSRGMAVILDWVGYETAADHPWVNAHPDWYKKDGGGSIVKPFPDCAALNTTNTEVVDAMIQYMRNWVFTANIDGFRCDWADYSEPDYWKKVIANLRGISSHKLIMMAEGSNEGSTSGCTTCGNNQPGYHYSEGFDLIFGENFYWNFMKKVYANGETAKNVDGINTGEYVGASATQLVARYMSNHDEFGSDGSPYSWMGGKKPVMSAFVIATYMHGVPFIYNGVEVGNTSSLSFPWNTGTINWQQDLTVLADMKQILAFRNSSDAIRRGVATSYTTADVIAFTKTSATQTAFVAVNVRKESKTFTLPAGIANSTMYDGFTNLPVSFGTTITLDPYQYLAYVGSGINHANVSATGVSIDPKVDTINSLGGTVQLTASISPATATNKNVTWTSANPSVATVSSSGLVSGNAVGTVTITAKTTDGGLMDSAVITVLDHPQFTAYFFKPDSWGPGINIYWWAAAPTGSLADGAWPGASMTSANGWYSYSFPILSSINLIFNDGTHQTANLTRSKTGWYMDGGWFDAKPGTNAGTRATAAQAILTVRSNHIGGITIILPDEQEYTVLLTLLSGKIIASGAVDGKKTNTLVLPSSASSSGIRLVRITSRSGQVVTQKVLD